VIRLVAIIGVGAWMQRRGAKYWYWSDFQLEATESLTRLCDGTMIDVRARLSRDAVTQLFVGLYRPSGAMIDEEYYNRCPGETVEQAIAWGTDRGRFLLASRQRFTAPHKLTPAPVLMIGADGAQITPPQRQQFLNATTQARERFSAANSSVIEMMRYGTISGELWDRCRHELREATDHLVLLARTYGQAVERA
jgi:hypothetical protein